MAIGGVVAVKAYNGQLFGDCNNCTVNLSDSSGAELGAVTDARPARLLTVNYLQALNDVDVDGALNVDGSLTVTGSLSGKEAYSSAGTTTLALADSGKTFLVAGAGPVFTLPATTTGNGIVYRFVVGDAVSANATIVTSDGGNNIEGAMIVAGAVVDCAAEDTITFVADGENIGDFIELRLINGYWTIGASGALTGSKLTCTAT